MSTPSWAPVDDRMAPLQWWVGVVAGLLAAVLVTPLGNPLPPEVRLTAILVLALLAVLCALPPTFVRAWHEVRGRQGPGGSVLLAVACVLAFGAGVPLTFLFGGSPLLPAIALACAAHLPSARALTAMLRRVPGAADPAGTASRAPRETIAGRLDALLPFLPAAALVLAVATFIGWSVVHPEPWIPGSGTALGVLLVASPASLLVARFVPTRAARDRGRELGILFGDVDPLRLARVRSLVLNPLGVVTDPHPRLITVHTVGRLQATAALQAAASVAQGGHHPIHVAIVSSARHRALPLRPAGSVSTSGLTISAYIKGTIVTVGDRDAFERMPAQLSDSGSRVFVGWGGTARAGFELVPVVRSEALSDWPDVLALPIRPVFVAEDDVALRHVGMAMEMRQDDLLTLPASGMSGVVDDLRRGGPVAVVGDHDLAEQDDVFVMRPGHVSTQERPMPTSSTTIRLVQGDFTSALRALGLARKTARVTTQGIVLVAVLQVLGLAAAAGGLLDPMIAGVLGAGLPLLAALNALRPRSFSRETTAA